MRGSICKVPLFVFVVRRHPVEMRVLPTKKQKARDTVSDSPFGQTRRVRTRWVVGTWLYVLAYLSKEGLCGVRIGNNKDLVSPGACFKNLFHNLQATRRDGAMC